MRALLVILSLISVLALADNGDVTVTWHRVGSSTNTDAVLVIPVKYVTNEVAQILRVERLTESQDPRTISTPSQLTAAMEQIYRRYWRDRLLWFRAGTIAQSYDAAKEAALGTNTVDIID
jgi:hypothetical protein